MTTGLEQVKQDGQIPRPPGTERAATLHKVAISRPKYGPTWPIIVFRRSHEFQLCVCVYVYYEFSQFKTMSLHLIIKKKKQALKNQMQCPRNNSDKRATIVSRRLDKKVQVLKVISQLVTIS